MTVKTKQSLITCSSDHTQSGWMLSNTVCYISVAVSIAPLPEYTIHTDLLNAAFLLHCITAASEHRPEECRSRVQERVKIWCKRGDWKGVKVEKKENRTHETNSFHISLWELQMGMAVYSCGYTGMYALVPVLFHVKQSLKIWWWINFPAFTHM